MSNKETEKIELTPLETIVIDVTSRMPQFPRTVAGKQIFVSCSASNLHVINNLFSMFRERYKVVNEGDVLAIAAKFFMESIEKNGKE